MKIIICSFFLFSFLNCCDIFYHLKNIDQQPFPKYDSLYINGELRYSSIRKENGKRILKTEYKITMFTDKPDTITFNSISFTRKEGADTIPVIIYIDKTHVKGASYKDTIWGGQLPLQIIETRPTNFYIIVASTVPEDIVKTKQLYVSYDISVGKERIVRSNIRYSQRLMITCDLGHINIFTIGSWAW